MDGRLVRLFDFGCRRSCGALGLAGVLLSAQQLAVKLTAVPHISSLGEVAPETIGLGLSLAIAGLASVFVRRARWLVAELVTRLIQEEIVGVSTSVDYESFERQDF